VGTLGDQVQRPTVDGLAAELEEPGLGTALAVIVVAVAALLLAVVPAAVALEASLVPVGWVAAALGGFAGFIFSLKLGVIVWGTAVQLWGARPARAVTENAE
jgi:hypothetical protein